MSLAWTSLTIGKDGAIIALETLINNRFPDHFKDVFLSWRFPANVVKAVSVSGVLHLLPHEHYLFLSDLSDALSLLDR